MSNNPTPPSTRIGVFNAIAGGKSATPEQAAEHNRAELQANRVQLEKLYAEVGSWKTAAQNAWPLLVQADKRTKAAEAYIEAHVTEEPARSELIQILRTGA